MNYELPHLADYIKSVGWHKATQTLDKVEATLRSRLNSGKNWRVIEIAGVKRCAMIDPQELQDQLAICFKKAS